MKTTKSFLAILIFTFFLSINVKAQDVYVKGYYTKNGTYVEPYYRTAPNNTNWDNYSTKPNSDPYNNNKGYKARDYSQDAYNYGNDKIIYEGPKGGQYYYNDQNKKVYVPKR